MTSDSLRRKMREAAEAFGDWFYPNAKRAVASGMADDRRFIHAEYETTDSLDQVRDFYWEKCEMGGDRDGGSSFSCYSMDRYPKWFFRNGPPMIVMHVTEERMISILAVPARMSLVPFPHTEEETSKEGEDHDHLHLYLTLEVH